MWFTLAVLSAVIGGFHSFGLKVAAERKYDSSLLNATAASISFLGALLWFSLTRSWSDVPTQLVLLSVLSGALYLVCSVLRSEALLFIDATILFPLYKVIGPAIVTGIGIFYLHDVVATHELVGIVLSCAVPLLLISRLENARQKNLSLGITLTVLSTLIAAISISVNAYAIQDDTSLSLPLLIIAHGFVFLFGLGHFLYKHPPHDMRNQLTAALTPAFLGIAFFVGVTQFTAFYLLLLAINGGDLSLVYSINAHYILIPIILSIWYYKEHWNTQKVIAIALSLVALVLLHR